MTWLELILCLRVLLLQSNPYTAVDNLREEREVPDVMTSMQLMEYWMSLGIPWHVYDVLTRAHSRDLCSPFRLSVAVSRVCVCVCVCVCGSEGRVV
jgi:hypothetical protein